jgi:anthranilate/para-aminobenzoate synthase component II
VFGARATASSYASDGTVSMGCEKLMRKGFGVLVHPETIRSTVPEPPMRSS